MTRRHLDFIDWMKCLGMFLIVMGHVAGHPTNYLLPPIYPKQLGVAFFIFVMGYSLAKEVRPAWQMLFHRLFEIYLFGGAIAVLLSVAMFATRGTLQLSNYMPLVLGVNVLVNNFPANPTTWYIGTYLHILLLWTIALRRVQVRAWMLIVAVGLEVGLRTLLIETAGRYIAYMLLPNWITVFLLGTVLGRRAAEAASAAADRVWKAAACASLTAAFLTAWFWLVTPLVLDHSFPFMRLSVGGVTESALATSVCVSVVYLGVTFLVFQLVVRFPAWNLVQFFARNTLIIFIAHMPVFRLVEAVLGRWTLSYGIQSIVQLLVCYVGLAFVSESVTHALKPKALRDWVGRWLMAGPMVTAIAGDAAAKRP